MDKQGDVVFKDQAEKRKEEVKFKELTPEEQAELNKQTEAKTGLFIRFVRMVRDNVDQIWKFIMIGSFCFFVYFFLKVKLGMTSDQIKLFWDDFLYLVISLFAALGTFLGSNYIPQGTISRAWSKSATKRSDASGRSLSE